MLKRRLFKMHSYCPKKVHLSNRVKDHDPIVFHVRCVAMLLPLGTHAADSIVRRVTWEIRNGGDTLK